MEPLGDAAEQLAVAGEQLGVAQAAPVALPGRALVEQEAMVTRAGAWNQMLWSRENPTRSGRTTGRAAGCRRRAGNMSVEYASSAAARARSTGGVPAGPSQTRGRPASGAALEPRRGADAAQVERRALVPRPERVAVRRELRADVRQRLGRGGRGIGALVHRPLARRPRTSRPSAAAAAPAAGPRRCASSRRQPACTGRTSMSTLSSPGPPGGGRRAGCAPTAPRGPCGRGRERLADQEAAVRHPPVDQWRLAAVEQRALGDRGEQRAELVEGLPRRAVPGTGLNSRAEP